MGWKRNGGENGKDVADAQEGGDVDAQSPSAWSPAPPSGAEKFQFGHPMVDANSSGLPMFPADGRVTGIHHAIACSTSSVQTGVSIDITPGDTPGDLTQLEEKQDFNRMYDKPQGHPTPNGGHGGLPIVNEDIMDQEGVPPEMMEMTSVTKIATGITMERMDHGIEWDNGTTDDGAVRNDM